MNRSVSGERGIALMVVLLLSVAIAALALAATMITSNASLITRHSQRLDLLKSVADAGLEEARARINGQPSLYPESLYTVLENGVQVTSAGGQTIPNVQRWTYAGPTGVTSGQYGVFGSIVSVAQDPYGNRVVRRGEVVQESFAKYAYFTDVEPSNIAFGGGDQLFGPVHSNDQIKIYSSGATFHGTVTTASTVSGSQYGVFDLGYTEHVAPIAMPQTADLNKLRTQASSGSMLFTPVAGAPATQATMRIEFMAIDLDGDGQVNGANEGFIRVYESANTAWLTGDVPGDYGTNFLRNSRNCGHYHANGAFVSAFTHPNNGSDSWVASVSNATKRCYLGGSDSLFGAFTPADGLGSWRAWPGTVNAALAARTDRQYLYPISRALNPGWKGVIFVDGNVVISGVVRGQVTLAATGNIIIGDDVTYATNPGAGSCRDILGLFGNNDIMMADNTLNSPTQPANGQNRFTYDDTKDEFVHAVVLALNTFTVENYASGSTRDEPCGTSLWGRGCLFLTGGIIQKQRGAVGTITSPGGTGYLKRYSYDQCAFTNPPPYFPTTGHFARGRYFEVDPTGFNVATYFNLLTAGP